MRHSLAKGFSLIELMIVLGIVSILVYFLAGIITPALNLAVYTEDLAQITQDTEVVRLLLKKDTVCTDMLSAGGLINTVATEATPSLPLAAFTIGHVTIGGDQRLKLLAVNVSNFTLLSQIAFDTETGSCPNPALSSCVFKVP